MSELFSQAATLQLVGESFCWTQGSRLVVHEDSHTSVMGLRQLCPGAHLRLVTDDNILQESHQSSHLEAPNLFCFPAMSNFNGKKYPLDWVGKLQQSSGRNFVLLDAAAFLSCNGLDLAEIQPAFIVLSFYKMFGYPTGLGALLIKKSCVDVLEKKYFGGGTVDVALVHKNFHVSRKQTSQKYEDGTSNFLGQWRYPIISVSITKAFCQILT